MGQIDTNPKRIPDSFVRFGLAKVARRNDAL
jgi:hypothetical protein